MADLWFYSHGQARSGPFTGRQLRDLADGGDVLPTDTVWKQGVETGMLASKVKHLFPPALAVPTVVPVRLASAPVPPEPAPLEPSVVPQPVVAEKVSPVSTESPTPPSNGWNTTRKGNATAGRGAILVGQDGVNVKYRKKCTTCNHLDSSWNTMPIRNGVSRVGFYCPKCRKHREVEIHGSFH